MSRAKNAKDAKVTGRGSSSRANARDLRKISPFGRNDRGSFFACLVSWRDKFSCIHSVQHFQGKYLEVSELRVDAIITIHWQSLLYQYGCILTSHSGSVA